MRNFLIAIVISVVLIIVAIIFFLTKQQAEKSKTENPSIGAFGEIMETGSNTPCNSDDNCWCRNFNGAKFEPGRSQSRCDLQKNRCIRCLYD